jgi:hypothetical protein
VENAEIKVLFRREAETALQDERAQFTVYNKYKEFIELETRVRQPSMFYTFSKRKDSDWEVLIYEGDDVKGQTPVSCDLYKDVVNP